MVENDVTWDAPASDVTWDTAERGPERVDGRLPGSFQDRMHTMREAIASEPKSIPAGSSVQGPDLSSEQLTGEQLAHKWGDVGKGVAKGVPAITGIAGDIEAMARKMGQEFGVGQETVMPQTTEGGLFGQRHGLGWINPAASPEEAVGMQIPGMLLGIRGAPKSPLKPPRGPAIERPPMVDVAPKPTGASVLPFELHPEAPQATVREGGARAMPPDIRHTLPEGTETVVPRGLGRTSAGAEAARSVLEDVSPQSLDLIRQQLKESGFTPWTLEQRLEEMSPHHMLAEVDPNMEAHLQKLGKYGGESRNTIEGTIRTRATEAPERINYLLNDALGDPVNLAQKRRAIDQERNARSSPFWKYFETMQVSPTPELEALMPRLRSVGAFGIAKKMAAAQGKLWTNAFEIGEGAKAEVPTPASWQLVKEALDAKIEASLSPIGQPTKWTRIYTGLKHDLIDAIDKHPDTTVGEVWKAARDTWAGPEQIKSAQRLGWRLLDEGINKHELPYMLQKFSKADYEALAEGLRARLENDMGRAGPQNLRTINKVISPNAQEKLRLILGDEKVNNLLTGMQHEGSMHRQPTTLIGGSQTGLRTAADDAFAPKVPMVEGLASGAHQVGRLLHDPQGLARDTMLHLTTKSARARAEEVAQRLRNEAALIYTLQGPERDAVLRWLVNNPGRAHGGRVNGDNIHRNPSEAQKRAGNYAKDHVRVHGLDIAIENAKGHQRHGVGKDGKRWSVKMPAHYGYIKGTVGKDKDHVDVYLGSHLKSPNVYVVDQHDADSKRFDEHKVFLGFTSANQARLTYNRGFSDGRGHERLGHMAAMSVDEFKRWLGGDTTKPVKHATKKETHKAVDYRMQSPFDAHCGVCSMFVPKASCTAVQSPIMKGGWCKLFDRKKYATGGGVHGYATDGAVTDDFDMSQPGPETWGGGDAPAALSPQDEAQAAREAAALRTYRGVLPEGGKPTSEHPILKEMIRAPFAKGAALLQNMANYSAEQFPLQSGRDEQTISTDYDPRREAASGAAEAAFNTMLNSYGAAPAGSAGIFGGRLAKGANLEKLAQAEKMAAEGAAREDIWHQTGWFQRPDKQWRFEIPDYYSRMMPKKPGTPQTTLLEHQLEHPELFRNYANVGHMMYGEHVPKDSWGQPMKGFRGGYYPPGQDGIPEMFIVNPELDLGTRKGVTLHEAMHKVQNTEGFEPGGSLQSPKVIEHVNKEIDRLHDEASQTIDRLNEARDNYVQKRMKEKGSTDFRDYSKYAKEFWDTHPLRKKLLDDAYAQSINPRRTQIAYDAYRRLSGEVEARNVTTRAGMHPDELKAKPPWTTEDVPEDRQILQGAIEPGGQAQMSLDPVRAYHGTTSDFEKFDRVEGGNGRGAGYYFTDSPEAASRYAVGDVNRISPTGNAYPNVRPVDLAIEKPFDERSVLTKAELKKIEDYLIKSGQEWKKGEFVRAFDRAYPPNGANVLQTISYNPEEQNAALKALGYDARIGGSMHGDSAPRDYVVFDDKKILPAYRKSVTLGANAIDRRTQVALAGLEGAKKSREVLQEIARGKKGAGPIDLADIGEHTTPQIDIPRYEPPRGVSERLQDALENAAVRRGVAKSIEKGIDLGAAPWYHTQAIKQAFIRELGPESGSRAFRKYMDMVAVTSPRSDVPTNIRNASFYYQHALHGKDLPENLPRPYGHVAQNLHRSNFEMLQGKQPAPLSSDVPPYSNWDYMKNPKPASFSQNLQGNLRPGTIDTHAFRNIGMRTNDPRFLETSVSAKYKMGSDPGKDTIVGKYGERRGDVVTFRPQQLLEKGRLSLEEAKKLPYFWTAKPNKNEYAAAEQFYRKLGEKRGLPTADAQAAAWAGGGDLTGLGSPPSHTFPQMLNERILYTAMMRGEKPADTLRWFIRGKKPLLKRGGSVRAPGLNVSPAWR